MPEGRRWESCPMLGTEPSILMIRKQPDKPHDDIYARGGKAIALPGVPTAGMADALLKRSSGSTAATREDRAIRETERSSIVLGSSKGRRKRKDRWKVEC